MKIEECIFLDTSMFRIAVESLFAYNLLLQLTDESLCTPNVDVKRQYFTIKVNS